MGFKFDETKLYTVQVSPKNVPGGLLTESFPLSINFSESSYRIRPTKSVRDIITAMMNFPAFRTVNVIYDTVYIEMANSSHVFSTGDTHLHYEADKHSLEFAIERLSRSRYPTHWSRTLVVTPCPEYERVRMNNSFIR